MPGITRPGTQLSGTPKSKRTRVYAGCEAIFPYPPVPANCIDPHEQPPLKEAGLLRSMMLVTRTDSSEWGSKDIATARACLEQIVTPANESLIRTYHPSLGPVGSVWVVKESDEKSTWLIAPHPHFLVPHTHAGGQEIHFLPAGFPERTITCPKVQSDPINASLSPRRSLHSSDLNMLRGMFPTAVGARVFISGFIVILFKSRTEVEKSWFEDGVATEFGNLRLLYDVIEDQPTRQEVSRGAAIATRPVMYEKNASLGLKLRFPDGREAITVPTHAFVKLRHLSSRPLLRLADWYARMKMALTRLAPIKICSNKPAVGTVRCEPGNFPLGRWFFWPGIPEGLTQHMFMRHIGTRTHTYDHITSKLLHFPSGFLHDLSLVTKGSSTESLPRIISPDGTPRVIGWGDYRNALDGHSLFIVGLNVVTGNVIKRTGFGISPSAWRALVEGSEYLWDKQVLSQSISILWRTEFGGDCVEGLSGSALCLGKISDQTCLAVCF